MKAPALINTMDEALRFIDGYQGPAKDFHLALADSLLDPIGANMAVITDKILAKGFVPDGFDQKDGYRVYKYKEPE